MNFNYTIIFFIVLSLCQWVKAEKGTGFIPVGKPDSHTVYTFHSDCEEKEGQACYDIVACPLEICDMVSEEGKTFLKESPAKKAAYLKKIEDDKKSDEDKKVKKIADKIKAKADTEVASTIAQLRKALKDYIEASEP